jgi:pyruvate,water dikinase
MFSIITQKESTKDFGIGGKAKNLFNLEEIGINVPRFIVLPQEVLMSLLPQEILHSEHKTITDFIQQINIPQNITADIISNFPGTKYFAVRSSAADEDQVDFSFAGQFESYLFVTKENLADKIKSVWCSLFAERVLAYYKNNNLNHRSSIAVIIQEMIDAEAAGVVFGINPINGNKNEKWISAVFGLGEGLVSGELNADHFIIKNGIITTQLANKTHQIVMGSSSAGGTKQTEVVKEKQDLPALTHAQIIELENILNLLCKEFGTPQDVEFAVKDDKLFILQARPITTLHKLNDQTGARIVWDNSNIIESYPGVTTPLTFSFIRDSYESAYKLFCGYMGVSQSVIKQNERVFANTLGLINGRVYYNLKTWYHMLAMVPGYSINARFMESMMGVKERFDIPESYRLSKGVAWRQIIKMLVNMYRRFLSLSQERKNFTDLLNKTISAYKKINFAEKKAEELMQLYLAFEKTLLNEWKAPLLNDFFAMIGYGMLQKRCKKYAISENPNIHNDLLCGSSDIISTQPIHRSIAIATAISADEELRELFRSADEDTIWKKLSIHKDEKYGSLKKDIDHYISDFGERCIGELKLESVSYTQEPSKFIKVLKSYVETGITAAKTSGKIEEEIRRNAEQELEATLKNKWYKKWKLKRTLKTARDLVSARENLRYERTRAFGMVREIFSAIGERFYSEGLIESGRDIFYLTKEEIFSFIEGTSVTQNIKALINLRKKEFEGYKQQNPPSERFATYGTVYHANDFFNSSRVEKTDGNMKGIGCCPGVVRGKVKVVLDASKVSSLNGDILVTSSTDPGWVTLFPGAAGIITERGSVLSHSAIVSREMGKPCIVSVSGLLKTLKTGDEIEMNGSTGVIKFIKNGG